MENPDFLNKKYQDLAGSKPVERAVQRSKKDPERKALPYTREERIQSYIDRIDKIVDTERGWELLRNKILKEFTIDTNDEDTLTKIAHNLYEAEKRIAIEQGRGGEVSQLDEDSLIPRYKELVHEKQEIQEKSLASWLDYLEQNDGHYPTWFRYFVVRNLEKMGTLDKEKGEYSKRTNYTVAPFPELNSEALGFVYRMLTTGIGNLEYQDNPDKRQKLETLILKKDFIKLYTFAQIETAGNLNRESIQGEWVKYPKGSDHHILEGSLKNKGTGWCTAEGSAYSHLQGGDFYVYYTLGLSGRYTEPRIAIRMEGDSIAEVRGVNQRQELEPILLDIAQEKYHSLPGGDRFDKKTEDMKRMTLISKKHEEGEELTKEDLTFLYEINAPIEGFGYEEDPRIENVLRTRDKRQDLATVTGFKPEEISFTKEEALSGNIKFHYGTLNLSNLASAEGLVLPQSIGGNLNLSKLTSTEGLTLPQSIGGFLDLSSLTSAEGLTLPQSVVGDVNLFSLTAAEGLTLPQSIGGDLYLSSLTTAEGLVLPQSIGGGLGLSSLTSAEGLVLPQSIGGTLNLSSLTTAEGLTLPQSVVGDVNLFSLTTAEGLTLPQSIGGDLYLSSLAFREKEELRERYPNLNII